MKYLDDKITIGRENTLKMLCQESREKITIKHVDLVIGQRVSQIIVFVFVLLLT
jgi:hypothetical protein